MTEKNVKLTGKERTFDENQIIVSKTDLKGKLTYANELFLELSSMSENEAIGAPHNVIRHPDMPRCIFQLLWDTISIGEEIFAYVLNKSSNGDHYWVVAHVTPNVKADGSINGYHSSRRCPNRTILNDVIIPLYKDLKTIEDGFKNRKDGIQAAMDKLENILKERGQSYGEFFFSL